MQKLSKSPSLTAKTLPGEAEPASTSRSGRSERTRADLLQAAETIFARDGFEASRIEDIAAAAGRSRGAFYANFESKTEVFLALRSLAVRRRARELRGRVQHLQGQQARYEAVIRYCLDQICDTPTLLLQIEFKLFALRHPEMLEDLAEKHLEASTTINRQELGDLFPEKVDSLEHTRLNTLLMEALLEGFALNTLFSPRVLHAEDLQRIVPQLLSTMFPQAPAAHASAGRAQKER